MITTEVTGKLVRNAVVSGTENKALAFKIRAPYGEDRETQKIFEAFVPCVMFNPPEELIEILTSKGKDLYVEFSGGIPRESSYEVGGERRWKTEVYIPKGKLRIPFKDEQLAGK